VKTWTITKRRAILAALFMLTVGCAVTYVKLPAREFIISYVALRDQFRDDTYPARMKCKNEKPTLTALKQVKCDELKGRMDQWAGMDIAVLEAVLTGNAPDLEKLTALLGPILKIALDIAAPP
jgi:hypothetical protein